MSLPPRCFTCGNPIGQHEEEFNKLISEGKSEKEILDFFKLKRYCCRSRFMGYVNIIEKIIDFPINRENPRENNKQKNKN